MTGKYSCFYEVFKAFCRKIHNFVIMKRNIRFLPPNKRHDLQQLVALIREHIKQVEMVILFGSYAKNKYVDYDQRVEFGTPTYYMSDYDIVILTRKPIGAVESSLYEKIKDKFFEDKSRPFHTHPQFVNYGIDVSTSPSRKPTISRRKSSKTESFCSIRGSINWRVVANLTIRKSKNGHRCISTTNSVERLIF